MKHWVWDDDPEESLCGKILSDSEWSDAVDCPDCINVDNLIRRAEMLYAKHSVRDSILIAFGASKGR